MSAPTPRFDPRELAGAEGQVDGDATDLTALARELEGLAETTGTPLPTGFEDRVMTMLADEPPPRPIARGRSVGALLAMTRDAWRLATTGPRPLVIRVQAIAIVLLVALAGLSLGSVAVVGASRWLSSDGVPPPSVTPIPSATAIPSPSVVPSPSTSPTPSASPTPSPSPSPTATTEPTDTAEPSETAESTKTPKPSDTAEPSDTPDPDDTPEPSETDDHSGPGGGGGDNSGPGGGGDDSGPGGGG